jgi:hypothetical protein
MNTYDDSEMSLAAIGGEPLIGSGFEQERPDPDFASEAAAGMEVEIQ